MSPFNLSGLRTFFLRVALMPIFFVLLWAFYYDSFKEGADVSTWCVLNCTIEIK